MQVGLGSLSSFLHCTHQNFNVNHRFLCFDPDNIGSSFLCHWHFLFSPLKPEAEFGFCQQIKDKVSRKALPHFGERLESGTPNVAFPCDKMPSVESDSWLFTANRPPRTTDKFLSQNPASKLTSPTITAVTMLNWVSYKVWVCLTGNQRKTNRPPQKPFIWHPWIFHRGFLRV